MLVDLSDAFEDAEKSVLKNELTKLLEQAPTKTQITVLTWDDHGEKKEIFNKTIYDGNSNGSVGEKIFSNQKRWEAELNEIMEHIQIIENKNHRSMTPLIEIITDIFTRASSSRQETSNYLIIFSDMLQNSRNTDKYGWSMYRGKISFASFMQTPLAKNIPTPHNMNVVLVWIKRNKFLEKQAEANLFWDIFFKKQFNLEQHSVGSVPVKIQ